MIPKAIKKKLEKMNIPIKVYKRMLRLADARWSKQFFCDLCFERMYQSGKLQQTNPDVLMDRVCDKCKERLEHYLSTGETGE